MPKRTSRSFRPAAPSPLEERLAPSFLGGIGQAFSSVGRAIADPYVRLGNRIAGIDESSKPRTPTFSAQIRRWTVIARVVSGEVAAPAAPPVVVPPPATATAPHTA